MTLPLLQTHQQDILFVLANPGGLRATLPVWHQLPQAPLWIVSSLSNLAPQTSSLKLLDPHITLELVTHELAQKNPRLLVTGTSVPSSLGGHVENFFRQAASLLKIPQLTILDHWCNYTERFTQPGESPLKALPDKICIMDERAKSEMMNEGFSEDALVITGQPAFENLKSIFDDLPAIRQKARAQLKLDDSTLLIGFVSEPVEADYGTCRGYTEKTVWDDVFSLSHQLPQTRFIIKLHPREKQKVTPRFSSGSLSPYEFLAACDRVLGMTSILLIEAYLLGKRVASFQPHVDPNSKWAQAILPVPLINQKKDLIPFCIGNPLQTSTTTLISQDPLPSKRILEVMQQLLLPAS